MYTTCRVGVLLSEISKHSKISPPPSLRSHLHVTPRPWAYYRDYGTSGAFDTPTQNTIILTWDRFQPSLTWNLVCIYISLSNMTKPQPRPAPLLSSPLSLRDPGCRPAAGRGDPVRPEEVCGGAEEVGPRAADAPHHHPSRSDGRQRGHSFLILEPCDTKTVPTICPDKKSSILPS